MTRKRRSEEIEAALAAIRANPKYSSPEYKAAERRHHYRTTLRDLIHGQQAGAGHMFHGKYRVYGEGGVRHIDGDNCPFGEDHPQISRTDYPSRWVFYRKDWWTRVNAAVDLIAMLTRGRVLGWKGKQTGADWFQRNEWRLNLWGKTFTPVFDEVRADIKAEDSVYAYKRRKAAPADGD